MLDEAGVRVHVRPAEIDDGLLTPGAARPEHWVMALAYLKARWVADRVSEDEQGCRTGPTSIGRFVLGADTVCVHRGEILGQPATAEQAGAMIRALRGEAHITMTGVCAIAIDDQTRRLFFDTAVVTYGQVSDDEIDRYLASQNWRGKAGAYNLQERVDAGWPIECQGDPATVMGLPMRRMEPFLARLRDQ